MDATTTTSRAPAPARGERFADPAAAVVWAAVEQLDDAAKHDLLRELREELAVAGAASDSHGQREARAVRSLREAEEIVRADGGQGGLSLERYRELFAIEGREAGWAPDASIRRWFGGVSWNDCLRRAGLDAVAGGDVLVAELGSRFTREEIVAALHEYARDPGTTMPPTMAEFIVWARRPEVRKRPGRRPLSQGSFDRVFGGFGMALQAAGLAHGDGPVKVLRDEHGGRRITAASGYGPDRLRAALREVAERLGRSPRSTEYNRVRAEILADEDAAKLPPRALPVYNTFQKNYPTWDDALVDAGLEPADGRRNPAKGKHPRRGRPRYAREALIETIRAAYAELDGPFTVAAYERWRKERAARDRAERRLRRTPSYQAIWDHFGDWATACEAALSDAGRGTSEAGTRST